MAVIKLAEALGTRYVINALTGAQVAFLNSQIGTGNVIDLAGCKMGPDSVAALRQYYATIDFQNSEDEYLDFILKSNCARDREPVNEYEHLDLVNVRSLDRFMDLVNSLPQGAQYTADVNLAQTLDKVTLILLIMARPDITFDIRSCASDVYDYVRDVWLTTAESHDKYYELIPPDTVLRERREDGTFGCGWYGYQREQMFVRNRIVLPWEFGNTPIIKLDASQQVSKEWRPVVEKCLDAFNQPYAARKPGKVLRNLLTFRE